MIGLVGEASAQDAIYNWSGSYVGVEGGYAHSSVDFDADTTNFDGSHQKDGYLGGIYAGHDWQNGKFVYGVVGDFDFVGMHDTEFGQVDFLGKGEAYTYDVDWVATARLRAGYTATDHLLVYATGGVAAGHFQATSYDRPFFAPVGSTSKFSGVKVGGVIGAGAEYALAPNWSLKGEYLHYAFDKIEPGPGGTAGASFRPSLDTVKFGVAYRF
ncbi:outer membrane protein [Mesorhizobium australafricanum]|uniref:Outer membrane beta-barrel protein n=1 Tax=Mesorhizobium australafricanum TaxID=3072311 RepID=A0ABU4X3B6_9HYPH|nr:outer membrane beta-barrel protein [Mesorhizobium sp. VK3E]MDX8442795.1 outer membrane beta-barrel protein [Mesorhizobium sp. VK3E]